MQKSKILIIVLAVLNLIGIYTIVSMYVGNQELETRHRRLVTDYTELDTRMKKEYDIDVCMNRAFDDYKTEWADFCKLNKIKVKNGECSIPVIIANEFDSKHQREKEMCITRYK
jgi:hypothetical protein